MHFHLPKPLHGWRELLGEIGVKPDASTYRSTVSQVYVEGRFTPSICTSIDTPVDQANRAQVTPLPL